MQKRYSNRPIVEFEVAAEEQMKITELRLGKLFLEKAKAHSTRQHNPAVAGKKTEGNDLLLAGRNMYYLKQATVGVSMDIWTKECFMILEILICCFGWTKLIYLNMPSNLFIICTLRLKKKKKKIMWNTSHQLDVKFVDDLIFTY